MSENLFQDVKSFHLKFWPETVPSRPTPPNPDLLFASTAHLTEELEELLSAAREDDPARLLDAIVDLVYVALGLAVRCGFDFNAAWDLIHAANMQKVRGEGPRGKVDVVKPDGWERPDLSALVW